MSRWLDLSFDAANVDAAWCQKQIAAGVDGICICAWTGTKSPDGVERALRLFREAGGKTALYTNVNDSRTPASDVDVARAVAGDEWPFLSFIAIDVETGPVTTDTVRAAYALVRAAGGRPVVYSSQSKWHDLLGDSLACAGMPVWEADYDDDPDLGAVYGFGSLRIVGKQYRNTFDLDGIEVDANTFDDDWLASGAADASSLATIRDVCNGWSHTLENWDKDTPIEVMRAQGKQVAAELGGVAKIAAGMLAG